MKVLMVIVMIPTLYGYDDTYKSIYMKALDSIQRAITIGFNTNYQFITHTPSS